MSPELFECLHSFNEDVLARKVFGVPYRSDNGPVIGEDGIFAGDGVVACISSAIRNVNTNPLSSTAYTVKVLDVFMYRVCSVFICDQSGVRMLLQPPRRVR